jgi:CheY-like chemotaxis protein
MPGMDGLEVCDHLRFDPKTREIPIIFLTAKGDDYTRTIASILDAYAFIEKPFLPDRLLAEVRNCLNIFGRNTCDDDRQHEGS